MKIDVRLGEKEFIRFSLFNTFIRQRGWLRPLIFAAILTAAAVICFIFHQRRGAVLLGGVLLLVAFGLPAVWFLSFFLSLRKQAKRLSGETHVYTLTLKKDGVAADRDSEQAFYPWEQIFHIYLDKDTVYLYISPRRAFLIPTRCAPSSAEKLWALLEGSVPTERRTVL